MQVINFIFVMQCFQMTVSIRFGTYNIQSGSNIQHVYNLNETARTIHEMGIDIIGLQEVDNFTMRHPVDQTKFIAGFDHDHPFQYYHFEKMRHFENGGYGIAILSRNESIQRVRTYHYGNTTADRCFDPKEADYCQGLILVEIPLKYDNNTELLVYFGTTHLGIGLNGSQQFNEAQQLVKWISTEINNNTSTPYLILFTGDFNSIPSDRAITEAMTLTFDDLWATNTICQKTIDPDNIEGFTFDSLHPSERIDYVFFRKSENFSNVFTLNCRIQVISTLSSDHRPVVIDVDIKRK